MDRSHASLISSKTSSILATATKSYSIDHILPSSKGGENTINNAGLICSSINKMKSDITVEEFLEKCIQVLECKGIWKDGRVVNCT